MRIGPHDLSQRVFVVAEIGVNHEGRFDRACWLIEQAAKAGANAVKFQTYRAEEYIAPSDAERFARVQRFQFSFEQFRELAAVAKACRVQFLSTPLDVDSVDALEPLVPVYKVASGDLTHHPLLRAIAAKGKPIILSTGMGSEAEIARALDVIQHAAGRPLTDSVVLMHCISSYPAAAETLNLRSIPFLRERFGLPVGYSDHSLGTLACEAAVALGAQVIEKHVTDQREGRAFRDHQLSLEPAELADLVTRIRQLEPMLGVAGKPVGEQECANRVPMRRSIILKRSLAKGDALTWDALRFVRPATGLTADVAAEVVGRRLARGVEAGTILQEGDLL